MFITSFLYGANFCVRCCCWWERLWEGPIGGGDSALCKYITNPNYGKPRIINIDKECIHVERSRKSGEMSWGRTVTGIEKTAVPA